MRCRFPFTRIQTMQYVSLAVCVFVSACADQTTNPLTAPTQVTSGFGQTQAGGAEQLPFHGSLQALEIDVVAPPHLLANGTATGTGTPPWSLYGDVHGNRHSLDRFGDREHHVHCSQR